MTIALLSPATSAVRNGFILVRETLCEGLIPAERDGDNQIVLYETRAEAEVERVDAAEMRADALSAAQMEEETYDDGTWVEAAVSHSDGTLTLIDQGVVFTADALRDLCS